MSTETKQRDMSKVQFLAALKRHGMKPVGFMGYVEMFDGGLSVSMLNANTTNRRARLAYLLDQKEKYEQSIADANDAEMERRHREDGEL
jgi:hypothetical protein